MRGHDLFRMLQMGLAAWLAASVLLADPLAEGISHWEAGRHEQAVEALKKAFRENPSSLDACAYLGLAAAAVGDHELAVVMFDNALQLDPTLGPLRMELAQSYFALGLYGLAEDEFRRLAAKGVPEGAVQENIDRFLAAIEEKRRQEPHLFLQSYALRLEVARDSNARVSPSGTVHFDTGIPGLAGGGGLVVPIDRDGYASVWGAGNFEYRRRGQALAWQAQANLGHVAYFSEDDLDLQFLGLRLGPAWRVSENTAVGAMLKGVYLDKDYTGYLRGWGGLVWTSWRTPWRTNFRFEAELMDHDFSRSAERGNDGTYGGARLQSNTVFGDTLLSTTLGYAAANAREGAESYDRFAAEVRARRPLARRWQVHGEVFAGLRETLYDRPGPFSTSRRRDTEYSLGASLERVFHTSIRQAETWRVGVFYEYTRSCSNLDLYDYDRHLAGLRVGLAF